MKLGLRRSNIAICTESTAKETLSLPVAISFRSKYQRLMMVRFFSVCASINIILSNNDGKRLISKIVGFFVLHFIVKDEIEMNTLSSGFELGSLF